MVFVRKNIRLILIYLAIIILFLGGTFLLIAFNKKDTDDASKISDIDSIAVADGTDIYSSLTSYSLNYKEKERTEDGVEIRRIELSGLKNRKILKKIQNEINTSIEELKTKVTESQCSKCNKTVYTYVSANFSNVLSIYISGYVYDDEEYSEYHSKYLNYDLTTGNQIQFVELFTDENTANEFLIQSLYENFSRLYGFNYDDINSKKKVDYSKVEDDVLKVMQEYKSGKLDFSFSSMNIAISSPYIRTTNYNEFSTMIAEKLDKISFFHRFNADKSIYEVDTPKIIIQPGFYEKYDISLNENFGFVSDNYFLVATYWNDEDVGEDANKLFKKHLDSLYSKYKKSNVVVETDMTFNCNSEYEICGYSTSNYIYKAKSNYSIEKLHKTFIDYTILSYIEFNGDTVLPKSNNYELIYEETYKVFDKNFNELNIEDVIKINNDDGESCIDMELSVRNTINEYEFDNNGSEAEIDKVFNNSTYVLTAYGIEILLPQDADAKEYGYIRKLNMPLESFDGYLLINKR